MNKVINFNYFDLTNFMQEQLEKNNLPRTLHINEEVIDFNRAIMFNPASIHFNNYIVTAVRFMNSSVKENIYIDPSIGFMNIHYAWANKYFKNKNLNTRKWSSSGILLFVHNYKHIFSYNVVDIRNFLPMRKEVSIEDPRLYIKSDNQLYMYFMNVLKNGNVGVYEFKLQLINKSIIFEDLYQLCANIHTNKTPNNTIFEKNFKPFFYNNVDYVSYNICPDFHVFRRRKNTESCPEYSKQINTIFQQLSQYYKIKISQTSPAIQIDDYLMAVAHCRISSGAVRHLLNMPGLNSNFRYFLDEYGIDDNIIKHSDIYLNILYTFKHDNSDNVFKIDRFSNPFIFDYKNRKFSLNFPSNISKKTDNDIIISFGEGDVLCRDVFINIKNINKILIHDESLDFNDFFPFYLNNPKYKNELKMSIDSNSVENNNESYSLKATNVSLNTIINDTEYLNTYDLLLYYLLFKGLYEHPIVKILIKLVYDNVNKKDKLIFKKNVLNFNKENRITTDELINFMNNSNITSYEQLNELNNDLLKKYKKRVEKREASPTRRRSTSPRTRRRRSTSPRRRSTSPRTRRRSTSPGTRRRISPPSSISL